MAKPSDGTVEVELTPDVQLLIIALGSHALRGATDTLKALEAQGCVVTKEHLRSVVAALRPREFCEAALVLLTDPATTNEQMIAAAREMGIRAAHEAGPFARVVN
ncbi:hypothetical protein [Anaeromyxobacter dehalogenans]|uniref:Uncharacterized protein n=1 Tax=Anaeromyxobacter dehalogenans (strain 2CP-C) TaxID=290397 RepID=Q2IIY1_ANADE|nr:hypothetical protein [Anaeromyxobacter dehalogenans]ABC81613.1 hypothetical protein Adeh_1841 [Anaeromyxobacter dehalogenans 2CP-C]